MSELKGENRLPVFYAISFLSVVGVYSFIEIEFINKVIFDFSSNQLERMSQCLILVHFVLLFHFATIYEYGEHMLDRVFSFLFPLIAFSPTFLLGLEVFSDDWAGFILFINFLIWIILGTSTAIGIGEKLGWKIHAGIIFFSSCWTFLGLLEIGNSSFFSFSTELLTSISAFMDIKIILGIIMAVLIIFLAGIQTFKGSKPSIPAIPRVPDAWWNSIKKEYLRNPIESLILFLNIIFQILNLPWQILATIWIYLFYRFPMEAIKIALSLAKSFILLLPSLLLVQLTFATIYFSKIMSPLLIEYLNYNHIGILMILVGLCAVLILLILLVKFLLSVINDIGDITRESIKSFDIGLLGTALAFLILTVALSGGVAFGLSHWFSRVIPIGPFSIVVAAVALVAFIALVIYRLSRFLTKT